MAVYKNKDGESNKKMVDNWRDVQDINGRTVYMNWNPNAEDGSKGSSSGNLVTSSLASVMVALICCMLL